MLFAMSLRLWHSRVPQSIRQFASVWLASVKALLHSLFGQGTVYSQGGSL